MSVCKWCKGDYSCRIIDSVSVATQSRWKIFGRGDSLFLHKIYNWFMYAYSVLNKNQTCKKQRWNNVEKCILLYHRQMIIVFISYSPKLMTISILISHLSWLGVEWRKSRFIVIQLYNYTLIYIINWQIYLCCHDSHISTVLELILAYNVQLQVQVYFYHCWRVIICMMWCILLQLRNLQNKNPDKLFPQ